jgi:hypothetical protein
MKQKFVGKWVIYPSQNIKTFIQMRKNQLVTFSNFLRRRGVWVMSTGRERLFWFEPYGPTIRTLHIKVISAPTPILYDAPIIVQVVLDGGNQKVGRDVVVWKTYKKVPFAKLRANYFNRPERGWVFNIPWNRLDVALSLVAKIVTGEGGAWPVLDERGDVTDEHGRTLVSVWEPGLHAKWERWQERLKKMNPKWLRRRLRKWSERKGARVVKTKED